MSGSSGLSKGGVKPSGDMNKKQLNNIYNQKVVSVQPVQRRMITDTKGKIASTFGLQHQGQVATLANGEKYLVHKTDPSNPTSGGKTVVVSAQHMSSQWQPAGEPVKPAQNFGLTNLVQAGEKDYNALFDNCYHASNRMGAAAEGKKK